MAWKRKYIGERFGRLTVKSFHSKKGKKKKFLCVCDCGGTAVVFDYALVCGNTKSCGCLASELTTKRNKSHGMTYTKTYKIWQNMHARCKNKNKDSYRFYGGRGIEICSSWEKFENFLRDMGEVPDGKTLDRIDPNGNYKPENCRWATMKEQSRNRRSNVYYEYKGEKLCLSAWAEKIGISPSGLSARIKVWGLERALSEPKKCMAKAKVKLQQGREK